VETSTTQNNDTWKGRGEGFHPLVLLHELKGREKRKKDVYFNTGGLLML